MKCWQDIKKNVLLILTRLKRYTHKSNIIFIYPCECAQGWLCYRYYIIWCWLQILYIPDEEERENLWIEKYNESNDLHQVLRRERIELETYFSTKNRKRNSCYVKKNNNQGFPSIGFARSKIHFSPYDSLLRLLGWYALFSLVIIIY